MASDAAFVEFVVDQMSDAGRIASRKMFGEYAIYCDDKVVALVCDNQLFVKPTERGRVYLGDAVEAPPYPGAKQYFLVEDRLEDREWLSGLIRITTQEVPNSKPKQSKPERTTPRSLRRKAGRGMQKQ